jgi:precorrin-2 dehydrogenase/sirohydrochlorin ferrochelatase
MRYYPVNLDLHGRGCLVVGGGAVATRKVHTLLRCGARVTVVSPVITSELLDLVAKEAIVYHARSYDVEDVADNLLVFAATDDKALNLRIQRDAQKKSCLCNVIDNPRRCDFTLPAVVRRGDLTIAVSTAGKSPAFAKHLRLSLEAQFGKEYGPFLTLMGAIRSKLLEGGHDPVAHQSLFAALIEGDLLERIKNRDIEGIDCLLDKILGQGFTYKTLMPSKDSRK